VGAFCGHFACSDADVAHVACGVTQTKSDHAQIQGPGPNSISAVAQPLRKDALDSAGDPAAILKQTFDLERRGFDQQQVQDYLRAISEALSDAQHRESDMRTRVAKAVRRAEAAEKSLRTAPASQISESNRQVGDDVTSVLDAARIAGEQRISAAEKSAATLIANAKAEAAKMRSEAESVLTKRKAAAEVAGADIVAAARAESATEKRQAKAEVEKIMAQSVERVTRVRNECDALIHEAEEARAQILEDMERRRREARAQVERLRVGRDRLLRSYEVVRRTLEETTVELKSSLREAKVRGDTAARTITAEPLAGRDQLEIELLDAKMIGRIKISEPPADQSSATTAALRSPALPRPLDPPQKANEKPRRPRVSQAMKKGTAKAPGAGPTAPAAAPTLEASPPTSDVTPEDAVLTPTGSRLKRKSRVTKVSGLDGAPKAPKSGSIDADLAQLEDDNLNVVQPADEIEQVVAVPVAEADRDPAAINLFEMLRAQRSQPEDARVEDAQPEDARVEDAQPEDARVEDAQPEDARADGAQPEDARVEDTQPESSGAGETFPGIEAQRDAVIADAAKQLEKRLKRALADEQNELLAGLRSTKKRNKVVLTSIVGNIDVQLNRYLAAINEVALVTYGAGAALIDADPNSGLLPAGAVEELLVSDVVLPIRERLELLDALDVEAPDSHVDPVRAFYRQRKTDHLGFAASRLANLLCVAGVCDALPDESSLPWETQTK